MARRRGALKNWGHGSSEYRQLNRAVRSAIRRDTRDDVCRRIHEQGPASMWRNTREIIGGKSCGQRTLPSVSADRMLTGLAHLRHHLPESVLSTLVSALVLSHVRYCITVYGNGTAKNLDRIQKILNFSARVISGRKKYEHISDVQRGLGWLSASDLANYHTLTLMHKVLRHGEPKELAEMFRKCADVRDRETRQDGMLRVPRCRTACGQRQFAYRAVKLYNAFCRDRPIRAVIPT